MLVGVTKWLRFYLLMELLGPSALPSDGTALVFVAMLTASSRCVISPHDGYLFAEALSPPRDGSVVGALPAPRDGYLSLKRYFPHATGLAF